MSKSILFLLALAIVLFSRSLPAQTLPEAWVCPSGDCGQGSSGFNSIQQAVNAVRVGGVVHVADGTYAENVLIQSSVTLQGRGQDRVVVQGNSLSDCLTVHASDVVIDRIGFHGGRNGLSGEMTNSSVRHCTFEGFLLDGIHLLNSDFNLIEGNTIVGNGATSSGNGLFVRGSRNNSIVGNTMSGNACNIYIAADNGRASHRNVVHGNTLLDPRFWSVELATDAVGTNLNFNVFNTNITNDRYVRNTTTGIVNAQHNWFGGENPPQSSDFSGGVDYTNHYATNMTIFMFPVVHYMKPGDELDVFVLGLVPPGSQVRGTTLSIGWSNAVVQLVGTPTQGSFYTQKLISPQVEFFAFDPLFPTNSVTIDQSLMGGSTGAGNPAGIPYVGLFHILRFQGVATGTTVLSFGDVLVRDQNNVPITPTVVAPTQIVVDAQPPTITNINIDNTTLNTDENGDTFDDYVKHTDNVFISATITDNTILIASTITADLSGFYGGVGHTADLPNSFAANVATWIVNNVNCLPANGPITVLINAKDTLDNMGAGTKSIIADNIAPSKVLGFTAAPGHKKVTLQWSDPASNDTHFKGVTVRYNRWNDYPLYGIATPAFPASPTSGSEAVAIASGTSAIQTFALPDRDVYYYTAFGVDWAGNFSIADAASQDRSTNYFLGDLGSGTGGEIPGTGGYNGCVNFDDLNWFSFLYGTNGSFPYPAARECDFAPTAATKNVAARSRFGIPVPDGKVNFEDLIIFSLNYGSVSPKIAPPANSEIADAVGLSLTTSIRGNETFVTLHLANDGSHVKGCSALVRFDPSVMHYVAGTNGNVFGGYGQGLYFFTNEPNGIRVDAAVLGTDRSVNFSGDVAALRFRNISSTGGEIRLVEGTIRTLSNADIAIGLRETPPPLPMTIELKQNYPNPFNPTTTIEYTLPRENRVTVDVMNILGEVVARLVDDVKEPGYHQAVWDAKNTNGEPVASGLYLCRMKAGEYSAVKKMMLVR